jgi:hypothetical protein
LAVLIKYRSVRQQQLVIGQLIDLNTNQMQEPERFFFGKLTKLSKNHPSLDNVFEKFGFRNFDNIEVRNAIFIYGHRTRRNIP